MKENPRIIPKDKVKGKTPTKQNQVSFRCPVTGLLCVIEDPTQLQLQLINQHKLTAMKLMR